jgi:hypothetical protein
MEVFVPTKKTEVSNVPVQLAIQVLCVLGKVIACMLNLKITIIEPY